MTATVTRAEAERLTRLIISDRLGLPVAAITHNHEWEFHMGSLDEGARCVTWYRDFVPPRDDRTEGRDV